MKPDNVKIEYIYNGVATELAASTPNDGSFEWNVPASQTLGQYAVRITSVADSAVTTTSGAFNVAAATIALTSPNGGESWARGTTQPIAWTSNVSGQVRIDLYQLVSGELVWAYQIAQNAENNGLYSWTVPASALTPAANYRVRVTLASDALIYSQSAASFSIIAAQTISVTNPVAGATWALGSRQTLSWTSDLGGTVNIQLLKDGSAVSTIATGVSNAETLEENTFVWTVPTEGLTLGDGYSVKIVSVEYSGVSGTSGSFTLQPDPYILVQSPNGGESWASNTRYNITWTSNAGGSVALEYSANGETGPWTAIIVSTPNNGVYSWKTPDAVGTAFRVRVTSVEDTNVLDTSDADFTLAAANIAVTSPVGGENWVGGRVYPIQWTSNLFGATTSDATVVIELSDDNGATWEPIVSGAPNVGLYYWQIPAEQQIGGDYLVRVSSASATGQSAAAFAIGGNPFVQVVSPNGGEEWAIGSQRTIAWKSNVQGYVKLNLYAGTTPTPIVSSTLNNGSYLWTVAGAAGTNYRIEVVSVSDASVSDISDAPFTIAAPAIAITSPVGTNIWTAGTTQNIAWNSNIGGNVKIELLKDGAVQYTIVSGAANNNSYSWAIPINTTTDTEPKYDYQVKVTSELYPLNPLWTATSAAFAIVAPTIQVLSPTDGVIWGKGAAGGAAKHTIQWTSGFSASATVGIYYYDGSSWNAIVASTPNSGSYEWSVPDTLVNGANYLVRVQSVDAVAIQGTSSAFSMVDPGFNMQIGEGSPNGGEAWLTGSVHPIVWYSNIGGKVNIQLYKDGAFYCDIAPATANDSESADILNDMYKQTFAWTLPRALPSGTDYTVVIQSLNMAAPEGVTMSLDQFTISAEAYMLVTSPAAGNVCCQGTIQNIVWESNAGGNVKIEVLKSGSWETIVASTPNDGLYPWSVTTAYAVGDAYKIRISGVEDQGLSGESGVFSIEDASIAVLAPVVGDTFGQGSTVTVSWQSNIGGMVKIALYKGGSLDSVLAGRTENDGSFSWQVPAGQTSGTDYTIVVASLDIPSAFAPSGAFAIAAPSLVLTRPNGGEELVYGTAQTISWTSDLGGEVKLELYQNGKLAGVIATAAPNTGAYEWVIPSDSAIAGTGYKIQISSVDPRTPAFDVSDASFSIIAPSIQVTAPVTGAEWKIGQSYNIFWTSNFTSDVTIDLYKAGAFLQNIATDTENTGAYVWTVPVDHLATDTDYSVRVSCAAVPVTCDDSDSFAIIPSNYIVLTSPVGGENWAQGSTREIAWETNFDGKVKICLFKNHVLLQEIVGETENDGSYSWNIDAGLSGTAYSVKVISLQDAAVFSLSDLFTITSPSLTVTVPNEATFKDTPTWTAVGNTFGMGAASGDFDNDGKLDVVVANNTNKTGNVYYGDGKGEFAAYGLTGVYSSEDVATADFNLDGNLDFVIANGNKYGGAVPYINNGARGGFTPSTELRADSDSYVSNVVAAGDVNGDSYPDIIIGFKDTYLYYSGYYGEWQIWLNNKSGGFTYSANKGGASNDLKLVDIDNDGDLDLVRIYHGSSNTNEVVVSENDGTGRFSAGYNKYFPDGTLTGIGVGDLNGDGFKDLILSRQGGGEPSIVLRNTGSGGEFEDWQELPVSNALGVVVADFNNDDWLDVAFACAGGSANVVYLNDGSGLLNNSGYPVKDTGITNGMVAGEFDGSLGPDLFCVDYNSHNKLYSNTGGVIWTVGTRHDIVWKSNIGGDVKVELCHKVDTDVIYDSLIANSVNNAAAATTYSWTIPVDLTLDSDYVVRVTSNTLTDKSDVSGRFIVQYGPYLVVKTPNGGEAWISGSTHDVQWDANIGGNIEVEYTDSAAAETVVWKSIGIAAASGGSISWTTPDTPSSDYKVRVTSLNDETLTDESDAAFSINPESITVTSPVGGENWVIGRVYPITWTTNLSGVSSGGAVTLELSADSGATWTTIADAVPNVGAYYWQIPTAQPTGGNYRVKVSSDTASGESPANFIISSTAYLTVDSPVTGDVCCQGVTKNIQWTSNAGGNVKIEVLMPDSAWRTLVASTPNNGRFAWNVDTTYPSGSAYKIRITGVEDKELFGESGVFSVEVGYVNVLNPKGGENFGLGATVNIKWASNLGETVKITVYWGSSSAVIAVSTPNDGVYDWQIPIDQQVGNDYKVVVSSLALPSVSGASGVFAIAAPFLELSSPNGGEEWVCGQSATVTWTSNVWGMIGIYLYRNNAFVTNISAATATDKGSYTWKVPYDLALVGTGYKVRVASLNPNTPAYDVSAEAFSVVAPAVIAVTQPNSGSAWTIGKTYSIVWESNFADSVGIDLYKGGALLQSLTPAVANTGEYAWNIADDLTADSDYSLLIYKYGDSGVNKTSATFTLNKVNFISLSSPVGDEEWAQGTNHEITWKTNLVPRGKVKINLLYNDEFELEIAGETENDGSYLWAMPTTVGQGDKYKIQIISVNDATVSDSSPKNFTVSAPYLTVRVPNSASFEENIGGVPSGSYLSRKAASGYFDSDNNLDVFVANDEGQPDLVLLGDGKGGFTDSGQRLGDYDSKYVVVADVDSNSVADAIVANAEGGAVIWLNDSMGNFAFGGQLIHGTSFYGALSVAAKDVNGDGLPDIMVGKENGSWDLWLNTPSNPGAFAYSISYSSSYDDVVDIQSADMDNDGDNDVVCARMPNGGTTGYVHVYLNDGKGVFSTSVGYPFVGYVNGFALGTLDGDSYKDIFVAIGGNRPNRILINNGMGYFSKDLQLIGNDNSLSVALIDLDGDWDLDALVTNGSGQNNKVYLNNGEGIFTDSGLPILDIGMSTSAVVGDFDGDRTVDVFITDYDGQNKVFINKGSVQWGVGTQHQIQWQSNVGGTVKLELGHGTGTQFVMDYMISSSVDNSKTEGNYLWTVPIDQKPGTNYRIKVTSDSGPSNTSGMFTIQYAPYILLKTPNGGVSWIAGSTHRVQWDANFTGKVKVEYTADSGTNWETIAADTDNSGDIPWTIPAGIDSATCKVRVTSVDYPTLVDESDGYFSIGPRFIAVQSPTLGDVWNVERAYTIVWTSNLVGNIQIEVSSDSGATWETITAATPNVGAYVWQIPTDQSLSDTCLVQVRGTGADGDVFDNSGLFAINRANFISLISPNGGEKWALETQREITWACNMDENIRIDLLKGGEILRTLATNVPASDGSYTWNIPNFTVVPPGTDYAVKVSLVNDQTVFDISQTFFTLSNPNVVEPITVTRPSGGEVWTTGAQKEITWTSIVGGTVKIDLFQYYYDICTLVASSSGGLFRLAGDKTANISVNDKIAITNSTGNNGYYKVSDVTLLLNEITWAFKAASPVESQELYPAFVIADNHEVEFFYGNKLVVKDSSGNDGTYTVYFAEYATIGAITGTWIYLQDETIPSENFGGNIVRTAISTKDGVYNVYPDGYISKIIKTIASSVDNTGYNNAYSWTIPIDQATGFDYGIRVTSNANGKWTSGSAGAFTIVPGKYIVLNSPDGGERWVSGESYNIIWESNAGGMVNLYYSNDAGQVWRLIAGNVTNTAGEGRYAWDTTGLQGEYFKVKVVSVEDTTVRDESAGVFSLSNPALTLTAPNGGENWPLGSTREITWTSNIGGYVNITLLKGGVFCWEIAKGVDNDGSYSWQVPLKLTADTDYQVQIASNGVTVTSAADFAITNDQFVQLLSPVGEEHWAIGTQRDITWNSNISGNLMIYLYKDGEFKAQISAGVTASLGKYAWSIPSGDTNIIAGTGYKVKLVSAAQSSVADESVKSFEIEATPYISLVSPNQGNEQWEIGSRHEVAWDSNAGGLVKIELGHYADSTWNYDSVIVSSVANTDLHNTYTWTIPPGQTPANNYRVRVTSLSGVCPSGQSSADFAIIPGDYIVVTSPNGGENWAVGTEQTITWLSNYGGTVNIDYSADGGSSWTRIVSGYANDQTQNSYAWDTAGLAVGTHYRVRVTSGNITDMSDADFSFSERQLTVTSPNGGEEWALRSAQTITWSSNIGGYARIDLSRDGFVTSDTIADSVRNSGAYAWTVSEDLTPDTNYKVRVASLDSADSDISDNSFSITDNPFVALTCPVGNERWAFGTTRAITWTTNMTDDRANDVSIDLYNAGQWIKNITARTTNNGSYSWTLPTSSELDTGANYTIKITCAEQAFVTDQSPAPFEIGEAILTQMSPNGGETLTAGAQYQIAWNSNIGGTVKLELYKGDNNYFATIATGVSNSAYANTYLWAVPAGNEYVGNEFRVKVSSETVSGVSDLSDAVFSIIQGPYLTVSSPNGGESLAITSDPSLMPEIVWGSNIGGNVRIEYSAASGYDWTTLIASTANDGHYVWDTGADTRIVEGNKYRVKVTYLDNESYYDVSNADFSLSAAQLGNVTPSGSATSWTIGGTYNIAWVSNLGGTVTIELLKGGSVAQTIATAATNTGAYSWRVSSDLLAGDDYAVRVSSNVVSMSARSAANFKLINEAFVMKLTAPTGGAKLKKGREYEVTWYATKYLGTIKIELSTDLGATWTQVVAATPNTGTYAWSVSSSQDASANCVLRLTSNIYGSGVTTQNAKPFEIIQSGAYEIITPNGGEHWATSSTWEIRWQSYVPGDYVKLELYRAGVLVPASESGLPSGYYYNIGNYNWEIPSALATSNNYRLKVSSATSPSDYDLSDDNFQIAPPALMVTYPTGSEEWAKSVQRVNWYCNRGEAVNVDLLRGDFIELAETDYEVFVTKEGVYYASYFVISGLWGDFFSPGDAIVAENIEGAQFDIWTWSGMTDVIEDAENNQTTLVFFDKIDYIPKTLNSGRICWYHRIHHYATTGISGVNWDIPVGVLSSGRDIIPADDNYRIRISSVKMESENVDLVTMMNTSQAFTIVNRDDIYLNFTSPTGGERWARGFDQTISWKTNLGGPLAISLLLDGTKVPVYTSLVLPEEAENLPNTGSYTWTVPVDLVTSDKYKIRLASTHPEIANTYQSANFSIVDKYARIIHPADGDVIAFGTQQTITWQTNISGNLTLALYKNGVKLDASVSGIGDAELLPGTVSYVWQVPLVSTDLPAAGDYRIRVSSATDATIYGENSVPFSLGYMDVVAPADRARWALGTTHTITWQSNMTQAPKVNIYLYRNSGFNSLIASNVANVNSYSWTIPNDGTINPSPEALPPAELIYDYYVVVESVNDAAYKGRSVDYFRVEESKSINVTVPNGEETWGIGQHYDIEWFSNIGGNVVINLGYYDAQGNWNQDDTSGVIAAKASDALNNNVYRWLIPENVTPRSDYRIKISGYENPEVSDVSDFNFSIGPRSYIIVSSPNGGERWVRGNTYDITWATNVSGNVSIWYSKNSGQDWDLIVANYAAAGNLYAWDTSVDTNITDGYNYRVKVISVNDVNILGTSEKDFSIRDPYIQIARPTGTDAITIGTTFTIKWSSNLNQTMNIVLYKGGVKVGNIALDTVNDGVYEWTVSNELEAGSDYQIGISPSNDPGFETMSEQFALTADNFIQISSPLGGEKWASGTTRSIVWNTNLSALETVRIDLYQNDAWSATIIGATENDGVYEWAIPSGLANGGYKVKVTSNKTADVFSLSLSDFQVGQPAMVLTSPNGGQNWVIGREYDISWESNVGGLVTIKIDKSGSAQTLVTGIDNSDFSNVRSVRMPATLEAGNDYKIIVVSERNSAWSDMSDNTFTLVPGTYLSLTAPVGGEILYNGPNDYFDILWSSNISGKVRISYSNKAVESWTMITEDVNATSGTYRWVTGGLAQGDLYKVKIDSLADTTLSSKSPDHFTVSQKDYLTIIAPNGGEIWANNPGAVNNITWASNIGGTVRIDYSSQGAGGPWTTIAAAAPNSGVYEWTTAGLAASENYRVRIHWEQGAVMFEDMSAADFTITTTQFISVSSPAPGAKWTRNTEKNIVWTSNVGGNVKIDLYKGGVFDSAIATGVATDSGSYAWTIPGAQTPGADYTVLVSSLDVPTVTGSSGVFTIISPSFAITNPTSGAIWTMEQTYNLAWTGEGIAGNARLDLLKGATKVMTIGTVEAAVGAYPWTIPAGLVAGNDYRVKITSVDDQLLTATSANFIIAEGAPVITTDPDAEINVSLVVGQTATTPLTIGNAGLWPLSWSIDDNYGMVDSDHGGPIYNWIEISETGTAIAGLSDDTNVGPFPIGFSFNYYGQAFSTFRVCSNGWLSFTSPSVSGENLSLPNSIAPANLLAFFWDDLNFSEGGKAYYRQMDASTLVMEFKDVPVASGGTITCEVILKAGGQVLFQYQSVPVGSYGYTVGIQNADGSKGVQAAYNATYLKDAFTVLFTPYWPAPSVTSGTLNPNEKTDVTLTFSAVGKTAGNYYSTTLSIYSNDPYQPRKDIAVTMAVTAEPRAVPSDFNGDGRSDVLLRSSESGALYVELLDGLTIGEAGYVFKDGSRWEVVASGDFNGDGAADLLLRNQDTGAIYGYLMDGVTPLSGGYFSDGMETSWRVAGTADLNGDGMDDIVLRDETTGAVKGWLVDSLSIEEEGELWVGGDAAWKIVALMDLNADKKADLVFRDETTGAIYAYLMNGLERVSQGYVWVGGDAAWKVAGTADFNGDGKQDILFRHAATGDGYVYLMNGVTASAAAEVWRTNGVNAWEFRVARDFNGDGMDDILLQNADTGAVFMFLMNGVGAVTEGFVWSGGNASWLVTRAGDFNGDGKYDILFERADVGQGYLYLMNGLNVSESGLIWKASGWKAK